MPSRRTRRSRRKPSPPRSPWRSLPSTRRGSIPKSLDEAATLDGASFFRTFWTINLPLAKSALATAGILMFLGNWNEYYFASLLTVSDSQRTLPIALAFFTSEFSYNYTQLFAALTIVILPGIILYALAQDQVQASVAASGVKG